MIVQVTISILLLLLNRTNTPTTGGLEAIFDQGKTWSATSILALSVTWSIFSTIKTHTNLTILEKGFCPTTSKLVVLSWATFATLRRILSLVAVFIPSLGLYSILYHVKWEQVPYEITGSISPGEQIRLYGLNETFLWSQLYRWDYTGAEPSPPKYDSYTILNLQHTFIALMVLSVLQFIAIIVVKICFSTEFREEEHKTNMVLHTLENLNFASPFRDWDDGDYSIQQFRERASAVRKEMVWTQAINFLVSMVMMVPLWYTGI